MDPSLVTVPMTTLTDVSDGCWVFSDKKLYMDGKEVNSNYAEKGLNQLIIGDRVGMMRKGDGSLHFFINGKDLGKAADSLPQNVYGVIDLYGKTNYLRFVWNGLGYLFSPHCLF